MADGVNIADVLKELLPLVQNPYQATAVGLATGIGGAVAYKTKIVTLIKKWVGLEEIQKTKESLEVQLATVRAEAARDTEGLLDLFPFPVSIQIREYDEKMGIGASKIVWTNKRMNDAAGGTDNVHTDPLAAIHPDDIHTAIATRNVGLIEGAFVDHVERIIDPHGKQYYCYVRGKRITYHAKPALVVMLFVLTPGQYEAFKSRKILKIEDIFEQYYQQQLAMEDVSVGIDY